MATDPLELEDDFAALVERVRAATIAAGEHRAPASGDHVPDLGPEEREAIMSLLRNGSYHLAAAKVAEQDPDLADQ